MLPGGAVGHVEGWVSRDFADGLWNPSVTNYLPHKFSPNGSLFKKLVWLGFLFYWADRGLTEPTNNLLMRKPSTDLNAFHCTCGPLGPFYLVGRVEFELAGVGPGLQERE